jgi:hypothetical protein
MCGGIYEEDFMITLADYETMLRTHDWYFHMSDDHRWYVRGRDERNAIDSAIKELTAAGQREEAVRLFNDISPSDFFMKS